MGVFQASMLEAMKFLREEMQSMKKASEAEVDKTSASTSKAGPSKQSFDLPDPTPIRTLEHPITRMLNLWKHTSMVLLFHHDSAEVYSPIMTLNTRIFILNTRNNLKGCVLLKPRNTQKKETQGSGKRLFTIFIFRGGSVLCPC